MTIRFKPYPEYKSYDSGALSELPSSWEILKLKFISQVRPSNVDKKTEAGQLPVRLCNYNDVYKNEYIDNSSEFMDATATPEEIEKFQIRKDDVIITKDSEDWLDIAVPSLVQEECPKTLCGYHLAIIRPDAKKSDGRYLLRAFQSAAVNHHFRVSANGITRFGLSKSAISSSVMPVPPLPEQRAIADFLDRETARIDGIVEKENKLIELLKEKRSALITRAVTKGLDPNVKMKPSGVEWMGEIPADWEVKKFKFLISKTFGGGTPTTTTEEYWGEGFPWVSPKDMKADRILDSQDHVTPKALRECNISLVPSGSIVTVFRSGILKHTFPVAIADIAVTLNQDLKAFIPNSDVSNEYLALAMDGLNNAIVSLCVKSVATVDSVESKYFLDFKIPVPSTRTQTEILAMIKSETHRLDDQAVRIAQQVDLLKEYKSSLITAAVTGKIDIRGVSNA